MDEQKKIIIYQIFTRLFGNKNDAKIKNGSFEDNGCGKMNFFDAPILEKIKGKGITHIWYTGIIRHASTTDYSRYGIPRQHPAVVKGRAGSPYAISDYYDVDPDLADNVDLRMCEFEALVNRTHEAGMKVVVDFVPNHVARQYKSIARPSGVKDLGEGDDVSKAFSPQNNFYYCVGQKFEPSFDLKAEAEAPYYENPAKATGNDHFDNHPSHNDWYETVKLNYGVDYLDAAGKSFHFDPIPNTWKQMVDILLFWASKGIDGFRCDMAEMVPAEFWSWAIQNVKNLHPKILFIGEVYNPYEYRNYVKAGFDYLYDKVGMYDTMRSVICGNGRADEITRAWQNVDDIHEHMLFFLENHDEQRIASDFFAGDGFRAIPAVITNVLMRPTPFMIYAGQEYGERGMDEEGFSGRDGRTTIFDYWTVDSLYHAYVKPSLLSDDEKALEAKYSKILNLANSEKASYEGDFFDLMYVNPNLANKQYAFLRKADDDVLLVVSNFSSQKSACTIIIPDHAFDFLKIQRADVKATDLLSGKSMMFNFKSSNAVTVDIEPLDGVVLKFKNNMDSTYALNDHNKQEFPPAHTAEHLLNRLMMNMFGCERSSNAHIERKKSKMTFIIDHKPSRSEEKEIEAKMNQLIQADLPVKYEYVSKDNVPDGVKLDRLPDDASETIRLVRIGDYDVCPCIGKHVRSTSQIGRFVMLGTNWDEMQHAFRIRFKVVQ